MQELTHFSPFFLTFLSLMLFQAGGLAAVSDPVADFKTLISIAPDDKVEEWVCDLAGGGASDVLLCLKSDFDMDNPNESPSWTFYISNAAGGYTKSAGTSQAVGSLSVDNLPRIDIDCCFVGQIAELGKRGIVSVTYTTPRTGVTAATIDAYTVDGDHLVRTQLSQYDPDGGANAVFDKYLSDDRRTHITLQEVFP